MVPDDLPGAVGVGNPSRTAVGVRGNPRMGVGVAVARGPKSGVDVAWGRVVGVAVGDAPLHAARRVATNAQAISSTICFPSGPDSA